eukprot:2464347-Prymnesium_polylepis.1
MSRTFGWESRRGREAFPGKVVRTKGPTLYPGSRSASVRFPAGRPRRGGARGAPCPRPRGYTPGACMMDVWKPVPGSFRPASSL